MPQNWDQLNSLRLAMVHPLLKSRAEAFLAAAKAHCPNDVTHVLAPTMLPSQVPVCDICHAVAVSIPVLVCQALRTYQEQGALYAKGRSVPGNSCGCNGVLHPAGSCQRHPRGLTVTNAAPGYSSHNFGLAIDVVPDDASIDGLQADWNADHPAWKRILAIAPTCGLAEGAVWRSFPDNPHLYLAELKDTPTDEMRALYRDGGLAAVWRRVDEMLLRTRPIVAASASV